MNPSLVKGFRDKLDSSGDFADIFEVVKEAVEKVLHKSRAGLMLGLSNLGGSAGYLIGAYYPMDSNLIVLNTFPLRRLIESDPALLKPYLFQVLMHEYLHSLEFYDESVVRKLTAEICHQVLGRNHLASQIARDTGRFLPWLVYPHLGWYPKEEPEIEIVSGFDKGNLTYVS